MTYDFKCLNLFREPEASNHEGRGPASFVHLEEPCLR